MTAHQATPDAPAAVFLGTFHLVVRNEDQMFSRAVWGDLACALIADEDGRPDLSGRFVAGAEMRLRVNQTHHEALIVGNEVVLSRIRENRRRKRLHLHQRAARLNTALADPGPTDEVLRLLRRAGEHRAKAEALQAADRAARTRRNRAEIKKHYDAARALQDEAEAKNTAADDLRWVLGATSESVQLAQARGEEVEHEEIEMRMEVRDEHGAQLRHKAGPNKGEPVYHYDRVTRTVLKSRGGGIEEAYEKGHLDGRGAKAEALKSIGERYGKAYEIDEGKTSSRGEGGGGFGPKGPQLRLVEAGETLAILRQGLSKRERDVLDKVCGDQLRTRQAATALKAGFPATARALRGGLQRALDNWAEAMKREPGEGAPGDAAERVKRMARMIGKVRRP